ncbi:serine/threonine-protein kinase [Streptomyces katsurahamanus]|uniref:non-specific serine/threonine protein kinase n=1 Tax=Streptomyces katsurahamanus TaxID=2577098 RepID=A0ABW9NP62_9ACTN|nr:protein kinase [Streptomyces katsurahamanus]MQS35065.1 serine/threonine protein kinase [Streptomyces katsurahamanus]
MRPVGSKYLLEQPLGRGATGTVWRARQRETAGAEAAVPGQPGETVAIKVLKEELANDADVVMRFLRERSVLLRLTHPNIVRTRDLVVEGDLLALVMDLIDGPDLHRYLRENGPFTPVAAALLTAQVADALAASHADGIVHRDLKPANVLLKTDADGQMHPMLTDFGIARLADSPGLTRAHEFVGTPSYVAPESAEGRPQTSAVDVYGAGILLYELVTGRPPFAGGTALEVLHRHLSEEPRRPTTVPEPLWTVIERCLSKEPGGRPSAENLARGLRAVAAGIGVHSTPAQVDAALGVAALLAPDPSPAPVPQTPGAPGAYDSNAATSVMGQTGPLGAADPTSVLPHTGAADPTSVLPRTGAADPTSVLPHTGAADPTAVMPPVPPRPDGERQPGAQPGDPHPWQSQLQAARDRNDQTQVQYLDPSQDPLRRRPQRQPQHPQQPPHPPQQQYAAPHHQQPHQQPRQQPHQQPGPPQYQPPQPPPRQQPMRQRPQPQQPQPRQQQYAPQPYAPPQQPQQSPPQQPQQPQRPAPREREPREPREPRRRSANPMRIPGLGCLKGCLVSLAMMFIAGWLVWELTPLQDWVAQGKSYWDAIGDGISTVSNWISDLGGSDPGAGSGGQ